MNTLLNAMKAQNAQSVTENGGRTYNTTMNGLMDLFALGAAYRCRNEADVVNLFLKAFNEDETYAMKCLFYIRDVRGGQGERRFFRTVMRYLANNKTDAARRNLQNVAEFGRWDDLYAFVGTPLEKEAFGIMYHQLALDVSCKTPSLLAKWLKSENTSSAESRRLAGITRKYFNMTSRQYRKTLSALRAKINIVERLMSENRWDEIEFDKIPSRAGFIYRNAFARRDIIKAKYEKFAKDTTTKVNAGTLNPCDVVNKARQVRGGLEDTERLMVNKYWDNLTDYFQNAIFNGVAVVDTSGSMTGWGDEIAPIDVAISLGMYCAEKCNPNSPWHGHYITFSREARLVPVEGVDFCDKVQRIVRKNLCENTNIRSVFDLLLNLAIENHVSPADMPQNIVVISDMEFDSCASFQAMSNRWGSNTRNYESEMEAIARIWEQHGYQMPKLVFWNVEARQDNIPMKDNGRVTFVSGYSPVLFQQVMTGKTGLDLVLDKLNSERYAAVR
ncbi:MAG: DUF2828 domain-containing protein [Acetobacter sp.]|nr:DUF2828 domain-containing protein [Acetobacter sp.]